jgi:hypothetical protein
MALPVTSLGAPNAVVQPQPGLVVQAVTVINAPAGALLLAGAGGKPNVIVPVQPGLNVRPVTVVTSSGQFATF